MKRKKQKRLMAILAILLIIFAIAYVILFQYNKKQEAAESESETQASETLYSKDFSAENISSFSFTTADNQTLTFELADSTWYYAKDHRYPANQTTIESIISTLKSLSAAREIDTSLDKKADYGLDSPSRTVTVTDSSNNELTLYFGNANDVTGSYYAYTDASTSIYTVDSTNYEAFNYTLLTLINVDSLPTITSTYLQNIAVTNKTGKWTMTYKETGDKTLDYTNNLTWFLTNPSGTQSGMDALAASDLTNYITGLSVDTCVAYNITKEDLATYGLDSSAATVTVNYQEEVTKETNENTSSEAQTANSTATAESESETETEAATVLEDRTLTFYIGDKYSDDYYYITWDGSNQVCLVAAETAKYLIEINDATYVLTTPINIDLSSVNKLDVTVNKKKSQYVISTETKTDDDGNKSTTTTYTKDGKEFDSTDFNNIFNTIKAITSEKLYSSKDKAEDDISGNTLTLTYTLNNNEYYKSVTFTFEPYDSNYYSLSIDGTKKWLVNKIDIANIIETLS